MMSKIGKLNGSTRRSRLAHHQGGFSLIELLLTVVFVTLGSQLIQGGFLRAADLFGRYQSTLRAMVWSLEQEERGREMVLKSEQKGASGSLDTAGKPIQWQSAVQSGEEPNLYSVRLSASWSEGGRPMNFQKELYVYQRDASQTLNG